MKQLTSEDISELILRMESFRMEFKEAKSVLPASFWESYSAFANTDGGTILLGVKEDKDGCHIQGVKNPEKMVQDLWNNVNNRQKISVNVLFDRHVYVVDCEGKAVIVVEVPRAMREDKPVYVGTNPMTGSYRRNGEGDYRCNEEAVEAMIRDKCRVTADHRLVETLTIADLNQETLQRYRNLFRQCRPNDLTVNADNEEFLVRHNAAKRDEKGVVRPTLAAVLMFGDFYTIQNECPHYFVDYREKLDDNPRYSDRVSPFTVNFSGNLFDFYFRVVSRLLSDVKMPFKLDERLLRVDDTPVHKALRECLANTLIHADYTGRQGIVIEKTFRHVTFANPGALRLPKDIAIAGGTSDARNDVIFTLFALVEIGEKLGSGLMQLFALWEQNGWPPPEIQERFEPERTILSLDYSAEESGWDVETDSENPMMVSENNTARYMVNAKICDEKYTFCEENGGGYNAKSQNCDAKHGFCEENNAFYDANNRHCEEKRKTCDGKSRRMSIWEQEKRLLFLIVQRASITQKELSEESGMSPRTIFSRLRSLQDEGRLRRVGPDKGGHWEVIKGYDLKNGH